MTTAVGDWIGGRYELLELAGAGGMATVYRAAMHGAAGFTRPVAVKKIKPEFRAIENYINMFIEEARVGAEIAHAHIVQVYDFLREPDGSYYLVMEWVEGMDLSAYVYAHFDAGRFTPWQYVVAIAAGALRGLAAAHERRRPDGTPAPVIHRDVSPHNILVGVNGSAKLTDFGLARARDRVFSLTAPGTVKGKLSYLSPELTEGKAASPLSDQFSMGSVLWEALAGRRPFAGANDLEVFKNIRRCQVQPLSAVRRDLPPRLVAAVARAMAHNPANRFASARDMAEELGQILRETPLAHDGQARLGEHIAQVRASAAQEMNLAQTIRTPPPSHHHEPTVELPSSAMIEVQSPPASSASARSQEPSRTPPRWPSPPEPPPEDGDPMTQTIPLFRKK